MKMPKSVYNLLSISGAVLAIISLLVIVMLFVFSLFSSESNSYLGLFTYILVPGFLVLGLLLIPLGAMRKKRKMHGTEPSSAKWPVLDLNSNVQRKSLLGLVLITTVLIVLSAFGTYQAYHYTESVKFCGTVCHKVMEPEYVTYQHSSHANVKCVSCHIGEGADWYVKSKLSGLYQVYSVLFHKYSQPIPTPLHNLRPASETCEKCHWPEKFYPQNIRSMRSYLADSANTEWNTSLLMKTGPENSAKGLTEGIHWHINKDFRIEYIAATRDRESIPWIRLTNVKTGEVKIFMDEENPMDKKAMDTLEHRTMDCMDCHTRPSHRYLSAPNFVDNLMASGNPMATIPYIKKAAMEALKISYSTKDTAHMEISKTMLGYYKDEHPGLYQSQLDRVKQAILAVQGEYDHNVFPYMKADASKYRDHIGHLETDGCFRCHSGRHKTSTGETISRDCNLCHSILAQGPAGKLTTSGLGTSLEFVHPVEIRGAWKTSMCSECHNVLYE